MNETVGRGDRVEAWSAKGNGSWLRGTVEDTSVEYASVFLALDVADCEATRRTWFPVASIRRLDAVSALAELGG